MEIALMADYDRKLLLALLWAVKEFRATLEPEGELDRQCGALFDALVLEDSARCGMGIDGPLVLPRAESGSIPLWVAD